jgi:hypothetical protein
MNQSQSLKSNQERRVYETEAQRLQEEADFFTEAYEHEKK